NEAQKKVDDLREQLQIPDAVVNENAPTVLMSAESLRKTESLRLESKAQLAKEETMLAGLKDKPQEDLAIILPRALADNLLSSLLEQLTLAQQLLIIKRKDYGPENPEVVKATETVTQLQTSIKRQVSSIMTSLELKVAASSNFVQSLEADVQQATTNSLA